MPMWAANPLVTNVTKVVRRKNSLKCSTANKFRKQRLSLILDQRCFISRSKKFALCRCQRTAEGKMEAEKRERWMRLCVEVADGQDSNRLLELISEIDRLLHEKAMRLKNVRREASRYVIEAAEKKAS